MFFFFFHVFSIHSHIWTIYAHYLKFTAEWTGTFMMMMIRLTNTACSYYDGSKSKEEFVKQN